MVWLASREFYDKDEPDDLGVNFYVRYTNSSGGVYSTIYLIRVYWISSLSTTHQPYCAGDRGSLTCGYRPIFLISPNAKIIGGDGKTPDTAYELGL